MIRKTNSKLRRDLQKQLEKLEDRVLLAGDLSAQWVADSLNADTANGAVVSAWTDEVGMLGASTLGEPKLSAESIGGRSAIQFDLSDGIDSIQITKDESPVSNATDFSIAVAFSTTSTSLIGGNGVWYENSGLVDANTLGFGKDWGLTMNNAGQVSAGMGGGFLQPSETIYSSVSGLNDGELHIAVLTRGGSNLTLYVDGTNVASTSNADSAPRASLPLSIGKSFSGDHGFDGQIAQVRFYNGELSPAEATDATNAIQSYYNNARPMAVADTYTFDEDASILDTIIPAANGVLKNDTDSDGDLLTATLVETTQNGTLSLQANGGFSYQPERNFFGQDQFTYTANDFRASEPVTVTINVTSKYDPVVPFSDSYKSLSGQILEVDATNGVLANDQNVDMAQLRAVLETDIPGMLQLNENGSFRYDPQGFAGQATFTYRVDDGTSLSSPVETTLIINTPPVANESTYSVNEDTPLLIAASEGVTANDVDAEGDAVTVTLIDDVANGTLALAADGSFSYEPNENFFGTDSFTYQTSDGVDLSNVAAVSLTVLAVNDAPTTLGDVYFGVSDRSLNINAANGVLANDFDIEGDSFTAELVSAPANGELQFFENGSFDYVPAAGFTGVASFTYRANDVQNASEPTTVEIAINSLEQQQRIVVNEVHVNPDVKTELVEFVELHNTGDAPVDLSGWTLREAVSYTIPAGSSIEPGGYFVVTQNPAIFNEKFGSAASGPWSGQLRNDGDDIELWTVSGSRIDNVNYQLGFPWPTLGEEPGPSMQLINPSLDNDLGGSWFSAVPTPGAANSVLSDNSAPQMRQVEHSPNQPTSGVPVTITAKITDPDGVQNAQISYQLVNPGDYISISDERYSAGWVSVDMRDDGQAGDETADDGIFTAVLAADLQTHRRLVRYRISSTDSKGLSRTGPYADDPQPNFAYFVYDGVPEWTGAAQPGETDPVTYSPDLLNSVPTYHLITTRESHIDSQYIPDSERRGGYTGSDYQWEGSMVYDGQVYDHIRFRARGGVWRYAMGKNMWKFDFNRGHSFEARDDRGNQYDTAWDRMNFSSLIQQGNFQHRGEQGLFESVGFKLFNLAGTEAPNTNYVHFRIVENENEFGSDQYGGDFQGMYLSIEQPDGNFLDEHDLPDGNFYKIEGNNPESTVNQGPNQVSDRSDAREFIGEFRGRGAPEVQWWTENLDLERYYGYQAISHAIHHYDTAFGKNFFYYNNPETGKWQIHPWDLDLTWANNMFGNENHEFNVKVAKNSDFNDYQLQANVDINNRLNKDYQNVTREVLDLLYNNEQTGMLIDEMASFVYTPGEASFVDADRAMWDYNPIIAERSKYTNNDKNGTRFHYYDRADTNDYAGMINILKDYIDDRTNFINRRILTNEETIPSTPTATYTGSAGFPINGLAFSTSEFTSPIDAEFAAMEWRIAEVNDPSQGLDPYDPSWIRKYEIESTWESGELAAFADNVMVPGEDLDPGATYRVRVRMKDNDGHWSHWSEPVQFMAGNADTAVLSSALRVTEVNYNPSAPTDFELAAGFSNNNDFEFLEIANISNQTVDLTGADLTQVETEENGEQGVEFSFAGSHITELAPGDRVLVVEDMAAFAARYGDGLPVAGEWSGRLSNSSEMLTLSAFGSVVQQFTYDDAWYPSTDGEGATLELLNPSVANLENWNNMESWRASPQTGGSPGTAGNDSPTPGDSNLDGRFDSSDLVLVFQAGEYEDDVDGNSTFAEGDWNNDGDFTTRDLVFAFQFGAYVAGAVADRESLVISREMAENVGLHDQAILPIVDELDEDLFDKEKKRSAFVA